MQKFSQQPEDRLTNWAAPTPPPLEGPENLQSEEEELRQAYQRLTFHVENFPLGAIEWDCAIGVKRWSSQAEQILGWKAAEVMGIPRQKWPCNYPEDEALVAEAVGRLLEGRESHNVVCHRNYTKTGEVIWCEWHNSALLDEAGDPISILSLVQDRTEQKQAEQERDQLISKIDRQNQTLEALVQERTAELARTVERLEIEIARREQRDRQFSAIAANLPGVMYRAIIRTDGRITVPFISDGIEELTGIDPMDAMADLWGLFGRVHPDDREGFRERIASLGGIQQPREHQEFRIISASGELKWVQDNTHYTWMENGDVIADGVMLNISDRKQAEEAMRQQVERERLLGAIAQRIRQSLDLTTILSTTVEEVQQVLGCDRVLVYRVWADGTGSAIAEAVKPGWLKVLNRVFPEEVFPPENYQRYIEGRICALVDRDSGQTLPCLVEFMKSIEVRAKLVVPIVEKDTLWGLLIAHQCSGPRQWQTGEIDLLASLATQLAIAIQQSELYERLQVELSDRKKAQCQIKASLEEKELLLKEVHHRVKNNLQVISSIFSLQSSYIEEPRILSILRDSQNRIASMALIHEKLYHSDTLAKIDFNDYIESLTSNLFSCYSINAQKVLLKLDIENVSLNLDTAIPCGLLLNELVSNSLKHAFPDNGSGTIFIEFTAQTNQQLNLMVRDTGRGLPEGLDFKKTNSLGLRLVRALTRQLRGTLEIKNSHGACFQITFPSPQGL
ncbi:histidine kinase dimerization/phosphoacceptor domain -containing protein [Oscillatoria sp. HE19RPO]|uniref:PAS domain-containing sensor histidine kinase n=1 Tax=Oscillatoria sp. HE19RPO TaxID=2954806 RepID=UPI0020C3375E|nr:histidine kinase dimerization/phosphoacceptor domain -containing protein [Oscillatoria sp. HE19RPO]